MKKIKIKDLEKKYNVNFATSKILLSSWLRGKKLFYFSRAVKTLEKAIRIANKKLKKLSK